VLLANPNGKPCGGGQVIAGRRWGHLVYRGGPRRPTSPGSPLELPTVHVSPATRPWRRVPWTLAGGGLAPRDP
jgi:hypothetical protein